MGDKSAQLASISDSEILYSFRDALVLLAPILQKLDVLGDPSQPYDEFDKLADSLWHILVVRSLMWKYGTDEPPALPNYGYAEDEAADSYVRASSREAGGRFVEFVTPPGSEAPFTSLAILEEGGNRAVIPIDGVEFDWVRKPPSATS